VTVTDAGFGSTPGILTTRHCGCLHVSRPALSFDLFPVPWLKRTGYFDNPIWRSIMKKILASSLALFGTLFALSLAASPAHAQATRTWVSGVGDDVNPCSRTAPCKTFAGAISKTAIYGEINCLDPGGFGGVTITKSITLDCTGTFGSILNDGFNGINIPFDSFTAVGEGRKTVNIRGINLQGGNDGLNGIRITGNGTNSHVFVEDVLMTGNYGSPGNGITDVRGNGSLTVQNTTIRNMGTAGISIASTGGGVIRVTLTNVRVANSQSGISSSAGAAMMIRNSVFTDNAVVGIQVGPSAQATIKSTTISHNGTGISSAGITRLSDSEIVLNGTGVSGTVQSYSNNSFVGTIGGTITPIGLQ